MNRYSTTLGMLAAGLAAASVVSTDANAQSWTLDFCQLDTGASTGAFVQLADDKIGLTKFEFSRAYAQHGETPEGMRTFGILEHEVDGVRSGRSSMCNRSILTFPATREFEATSAPGFAAYSLSVSENVLEQTAELMGVLDLDRLLGPGVHQLDRTAVHALRCELRSVSNAISKNRKILGTPQFSERLRFEIPRVLIEALASRRAEEASAPDSCFRQTALKRARQLLERPTDEPLTIREVCRETGVSSRTLNYAFREHFGVSPKAYLQAIRLHRVRKDLLSADPSTTIADVANGSGFWHMGPASMPLRGCHSWVCAASA